MHGALALSKDISVQIIFLCLSWCLDMKTIKFFNNNKEFVILNLKKWGVENSRITEMDWWDTKIIKGEKLL